MPLSDRDYVGGKHPPVCNCADCTKKRLERLKGEGKSWFNLKIPRVQKAFHSNKGRSTVTNKFVKGIVKLCLNLIILAGFGILIWHSYRLFTHAMSNALAGSIFLIVGIAIWILLIKLLRSRKYRWVRPSFKLTTFSVIAILLILTFAGVQPMSTYKDNLVNSWETPQAELEPIPELEPTPKPEPVPVKPALRNPSWEELKAFLYKDDTDKMKYVFPTTVCQDFAEKLQENAKEAGWRCALVVVRLEGYPDWYDYGIPSNTEHALNAFETTDRGLVYIDCTRPAGGFQPPHMDTIVDVSIGKLYIPVLIFSPGPPGLSMGTIVAIESIGW